MSTDTLSTVSDFISEVLRIRRTWYPDNPTAEIWYRGAENTANALLPGAYWRRHSEERNMVLSFRSLAPALLPSAPTDEWEWYYLMQHYGLPTRLLDWTENPLFALYFALEDPSPTAPCVWVLDPLSLNRLSDEGAIVVPPGGWADYWLPGQCGRGISTKTFGDGDRRDNSRPLAIFPKRHNPRIVAQRATFTIHGSREVPIDQLPLRDASGGERPVLRLDIDPAARERLWEELWALGVNKTAIYPEPQSLADDIKRQFHAG